MYILVGYRGKSGSCRRSVCSVIDRTSETDKAVVCFALEKFYDNEVVDFVEIWDDNEGCYVCGIDFLR